MKHFLNFSNLQLWHANQSACDHMWVQFRKPSFWKSKNSKQTETIEQLSSLFAKSSIEQSIRLQMSMDCNDYLVYELP